jgi:hypothetical protein
MGLSHHCQFVALVVHRFVLWLQNSAIFKQLRSPMSRKQQPFWKPKSSNTPKPVTQAKPPIKLMVAVFTGEERHGWMHPRLAITLLRLAYDPRFILSFVPIHAIHPVCAARNMAVRDFFLKHDSEVLVLFDNDVAPPDNVGDAIYGMPEECNIAVLPYWVWLPNEKHTMPCFGQWEDGVMIIPDPATLKPGWQEMGAGGTGCMFIRRKVFTSPDKLQAPFFKIISTSDKGQVVRGRVLHRSSRGSWLPNVDQHRLHLQPLPHHQSRRCELRHRDDPPALHRTPSKRSTATSGSRSRVR